MEVRNVGSRIVNTYLYPIPTGYVMVDTGYAGGLRHVIRRLEREGIALSELRCLFLTHAHDDHAGFLNALLSLCPELVVVCSRRAVPVLLRGQNPFDGGCSGLPARIFCGAMSLAGKGEHRFPPVELRFLDRLLQVSPGDTAAAERLLQGSILFTPGHTADSISLQIPSENGSVIFCGDAAMNGFPSRRRMTIWMENPAAFQASWDLLLKAGADKLYPGHGRPFDTRDLMRYRQDIKSVKLYPLRERK